AGRGEEVADPGGAGPDDQLDELRGGDREEDHPRLAGDGAGEQGLAGARRADQEHALGDGAAEALIFLRLAEEVDDLLELLLRLLDPGDVGEGGARPLGVVEARLALPDP